MSKYIIRNCPSCTKQDECIAMYLRTSVDCKDRNDCLLKQIVELCSKYHVIDAGYQKVAINYLSSDILKLLDIEEG